MTMPNANIRRQRGAALIVTLVLLLILTVIGVAGMAGTALQERMAGNLQDSAQVFEAAEAALRTCTEHVMAGDSTAVGAAIPAERTAFQAGDSSVAPADAERFQVSQTPAAQGDTEYQLRCLIEEIGPLVPLTPGEQPGPPVIYNVSASGARVAQGNTADRRPRVLLAVSVQRP